MKKSRLILVVALLFPLNSLFGQTDTTNFLKDYKVPDFKYRSLGVSFQSLGDGDLKVNSKSSLYFVSNLLYNSYVNNKKMQGTNNGGLFAAFDHSKLDNYSNLSYRFGLKNEITRRYYINDNGVFIGFGHNLNVSQFNSIFKDSVNIRSDGLDLRMKPTISIGKGRLEPIYYARKSWDIEKALLKSNSIKTELSIDQKTILADKIAVIQNRRFFDTRLNRIYQMEAIDSVLTDMGIIDKPNMKYYTHLSDAFLYTYNPNRLSGSRFEIGVTQGFSVLERSVDSQNNSKNYTLNGFMSYAYYLPQSFTVQHNFKASILAGKSRSFSNSMHGDKYISAIDVEYNFGYYPTTRTYLNLMAKGGVSNNSEYIYVSTKYYYYFSPRFRLQATAGVSLGKSPFVLTPINNLFLNDEIFNDFGTVSNPYEFHIGLNYAIF